MALSEHPFDSNELSRWDRGDFAATEEEAGLGLQGVLILAPPISPQHHSEEDIDQVLSPQSKQLIDAEIGGYVDPLRKQSTAIGRRQTIEYSPGDVDAQGKEYSPHRLKYVGKCKNKSGILIPHQEGLMEYVGGEVYEGQWDLDKWHGTGKWRQTWQHGPHKSVGILQYYEGEWRDDYMDGRGVHITTHTGRPKVYFGEMSHGIKQGHGSMIVLEPQNQELQMDQMLSFAEEMKSEKHLLSLESNIRHGKAVIGGSKTDVAALYTGEWKDGMFWGQGKLLYRMEAFGGQCELAQSVCAVTGCS